MIKLTITSDNFRKAALLNKLDIIKNLYQTDHRLDWDEKDIKWLLCDHNKATRYLRFVTLSDKLSGEQVGMMKGVYAGIDDAVVKNDLGFLRALYNIKIKIDDLNRRGHHPAAKKAQSLYEGMKIAGAQFYGDELSPTNFKEECSKLIKEANLELEQHRGLLGIIDFLVKKINQVIGKANFFSPPKTHSATLVNELEANVKIGN